MKKSIIFIAIVLIICLLTAICTSCIFKDYATNETTDLFKKATVTNLDGTKTKISKKHNVNEGIILTLPTSTTLNTIVLGEEKAGLKSNITKFSLSYFNENSNVWDEFYTQDLVEKYRYCVFNNITTNKIKLVVKETQDNRQWNLKKFSGHYVEKTVSEDFRVMGYAVAGFAYNGVKDPNIFNTVTHINVFQHLFLRPDGSIVFNNKFIKDANNKDVEIQGEDYFAQELNNIVEAIGDRSTKIIATILPDPNAKLDPEALHTPAFENHSKEVIDNINNLFNKYPDLDGVAFDYEYPYSSKANKIFGKFVKDLKTSIPKNKLLALALSSWQFKIGLFPHDALEFVDMVEMMAYDQFDERGYHSTFQNSTVNIVNELTSLGLKKYLSKINLGVPFYSRPVDGSGYWGDFLLDESVIGYDKNIIYEPADGRPIEGIVDWNTMETTPSKLPLYYNSPQMIFDKTAYCIDNKLGGMMIWHLGCDIPMDSHNSLLKAIDDAIKFRS